MKKPKPEEKFVSSPKIKNPLSHSTAFTGLIGLTRGFMYAGAKRVVVSLWSVNDKATSDLMTKFYRRMLKDNDRPGRRPQSRADRDVEAEKMAVALLLGSVHHAGRVAVNRVGSRKEQIWMFFRHYPASFITSSKPAELNR